MTCWQPLALTSYQVESLDFVGPNPLPCVGEAITLVFPAEAGIHAACLLRNGGAGILQVLSSLLVRIPGWGEQVEDG